MTLESFRVQRKLHKFIDFRRIFERLLAGSHDSTALTIFKGLFSVYLHLQNRNQFFCRFYFVTVCDFDGLTRSELLNFRPTVKKIFIIFVSRIIFLTNAFYSQFINDTCYLIQMCFKIAFDTKNS